MSSRLFSVLSLAFLLALGCGSPEDGRLELQPGEAPEPGVTYEFSVFSHCGIWELSLGGRSWTPSNIERGSSPVGTNSMVTEGALRLENDQFLVFEANTGLIVEFAPAPPNLSSIPPCD